MKELDFVESLYQEGDRLLHHIENKITYLI